MAYVDELMRLHLAPRQGKEQNDVADELRVQYFPESRISLGWQYVLSCPFGLRCV